MYVVARTPREGCCFTIDKPRTPTCDTNCIHISLFQCRKVHLQVRQILVKLKKSVLTWPPADSSHTAHRYSLRNGLGSERDTKRKPANQANEKVLCKGSRYTARQC